MSEELIRRLREKIGKPCVRAYSDEEIIFTTKDGATEKMSRKNFLLVFPELLAECCLPTTKIYMCEDCGMKADVHAFKSRDGLKCFRCGGTRISEEDAELEVCERCGREITWARCPNCGNEHEDGAVPPVTVCPVCGVEMLPLCPFCTYSLRRDEEEG